ncbi:uncharacterized protein A1O9_08616 [Exophiala aquamarina CBS 119918]|uniref:Uncharacterized protein n=1 Tax=Exophiala aquamarina CBS 119918 TaxID=1182545 RepID=A0A072P4D8_9EURO|nr:uncharacterized protein A1O9_08616 [Exophiala aquamarina CBS 119918]KEF54964.1 hypothetical protein A1O9_08616 [Exophiala aquamarina CBS 119918]
MADALDDIMIALGSIPAFNTSEFSDRLKGALLTTPRMQPLKSYFNNPHESQVNCVFGGIDCADIIQMLGVSTAAAVLARYPDDKNFHSLVNGETAIRIPDSRIQSLMTCLFTQHVNEGLERNNKPKLDALRGDASFVTEFSRRVKSPGFDPFIGRTDLHYALTVLFVYEYFAKGPGFIMPNDPQDLVAKEVLHAWRETQAEKWGDEQSLEEYARAFSFITSSIFSPTDLAHTPLQEYASKLQDAGLLFPEHHNWAGRSVTAVPDAAIRAKRGKIFEQMNLDGFQSLSHDLLTIWNAGIDDVALSAFWLGAIRGAEFDTLDQDEDNGSDPFHVHRTTIYGYKLVDWANINQDMSNLVNQGVSLDNQSHSFVWKKHEPSGHRSCFLPGTKVLTSTGSLNIEELYEGSRVLTRVSPPQWGVVSSEVVRLPPPNVVYGINGQDGFFTAGHVFFTSTGLRAIDPHIARAENPWLDVATLRVGHHLLQTVDGESYKHILISSIEQHKTNADYVYGVHLREGLRSYHANGFLVGLNYPEITAASIAEQLRIIPQPERLRMLTQFKELTPILHRFGGQTVIELLEREAHQSCFQYGGKPTSTYRFLVRDLTMPYIAHDKDTRANLFCLELYSGVVHVDGALCKHASFDGDSIYWSRKIDNDQWEHVWCRFANGGLRGRGRLVRTTESYLSVDQVRDSVQRFELVPGVVPKARLRATHNRSRATLSATDSESNLWKFSLFYDPAPYDTNASVETWKPTVAFGSSTCTLVDNAVEYTTFGFDQYKLIRNALVEHSKSQVKDDKTKQFFDESSELFEVVITSDINQQQVFEIEALHSNQILQASDQYIKWIIDNPDWRKMQKEVPIKDLTFTNIGMPSSFRLPLLVQKFRLKVGPFGDKPTGIITEFDPFCREMSGTAHWVAGTADYASATTLAAAVSHATNLAGAASRLDVHVEPHPLALSLTVDVLDDDNDKVTAIASLSYNQKGVNEMVQTMIGNIMAYHMNEDDRKVFVGEKPDTLPREYAAGLDSTTAAWMRDTYAPAYICQILAQSDESIRDSLKFTAQERKNIKYFWNGKGPSCLSRATIFKNLERSVTRYVIRTKYDKVGAAYDTNDASVGIKFSNLLLKKYQSPAALGLFGKTKTLDGCSLLTKIAAIMDALDGGNAVDRSRDIFDGTTKEKATVHDTNSNALVWSVMSYQKFKGWDNPYWGNPNLSSDLAAATIQEQWLEDAMAEVVEKLLDHSADLQNSVLGQMSNEIQEWGKQLPGWDQMAMKDRCLLVVGQIGPKLRNFIMGLAKTWGWVKKGGVWVIDTGRAMWTRGAENLIEVAEDEAQKDQPATGTPLSVPLIKGLLFTVGAVVLTAQIWLLSDQFQSASAARRGLLIMGVFAAFNTMAQFGLDLTEAILKYRGVQFSDEAFRVLSGRWDNFIQRWGRNNGELTQYNEQTGYSPPSNPEAEVRFVANAEHDEYGSPKAENEDLVPTKQQQFEADLAELGGEWEAINGYQRAFAVARFSLQVLGYLVAIGIAIFMTWQLAKEWDSLDTGSKIFQALQVALALIEAIGAAVILFVGAAAVVGFAVVSVFAVGTAFAASAAGAFFAMASVFASVTIVLAVVAVLVMVAMFIYLFTRDPPLNGAEQFIRDRGQPFANRAGLTAPVAPCSFSVSPSSFTSSETKIQEVRMSFTNPTASEVEIDELRVDLSTAKSKTDKDNYSALFHDGERFTVDGSKMEVGIVKLESNKGSETKALFSVVNHESDIDVDSETYNVSFRIAGPKVHDPEIGSVPGPFKMQPSEVLTVTAYGTVYAKSKLGGKDVQTSVDWKQTLKGEPIFDTFMIDRTAAT